MQIDGLIVSRFAIDANCLSLGAGPTPVGLPYAALGEEEMKGVLLVVGVSVWDGVCGFFK